MDPIKLLIDDEMTTCPASPVVCACVVAAVGVEYWALELLALVVPGLPQLLRGGGGVVGRGGGATVTVPMVMMPQE